MFIGQLLKNWPPLSFFALLILCFNRFLNATSFSARNADVAASNPFIVYYHNVEEKNFGCFWYWKKETLLYVVLLGTNSCGPIGTNTSKTSKIDKVGGHSNISLHLALNQSKVSFSLFSGLQHVTKRAYR